MTFVFLNSLDSNLRIQVERMAMSLFQEAIFSQRQALTPLERRKLPMPTWQGTGTKVRNAYRSAALELLQEEN